MTLKSNMFQDKEYEDLDDISKLVEPYVCEFNDELRQFPDKIEISIGYILSSFDAFWGWNSIALRAEVRRHANDLNLLKLRDSLETLHLNRFFEFAVEGIEQEANGYTEIKIDMQNITTPCKVFLVKKEEAMNDFDFDKLIIHKVDAITNLLYHKKVINKNINELAEIFNAKKVFSPRKQSMKIQSLVFHLKELMSSRAINIKSIDLVDKFVDWIIQYIMWGNLPALNNIIRLKVMTHSGRPIYSIEEVK